MGRLTKLGLLFLLVMFGAFVLQVEPDAAQDPVGAVVRASQHLVEACDNRADCRFAMATAENARRLGEIGWGLATGTGELVYVPASGEGAARSVIQNRFSREAINSRSSGADGIAGILQADNERCR